jgi:acetylornithine deacetylase
VERRTLPGEDLAGVEAELGEVLDACRRDDPDLVVETRTLLHRPPLQTDPGERVVTAVRDAVGEVRRRPAEVAGLSYWADSALLAGAGIPTVLFGPGGDGAHADTEWVSIRDTVDCARILLAVARSPARITPGC